MRLCRCAFYRLSWASTSAMGGYPFMHKDRVDVAYGRLALLHPPQRNHQRIDKLAEVVVRLLTTGA